MIVSVFTIKGAAAVYFDRILILRIPTDSPIFRRAMQSIIMHIDDEIRQGYNVTIHDPNEHIGLGDGCTIGLFK